MRGLAQAKQNVEQQTMAHSSLTRPVLQDEQTGQRQRKTERRQLLWRFLLALVLIACTVAAATMIASWMRPAGSVTIPRHLTTYRYSKTFTTSESSSPIRWQANRLNAS
jgi:lipopolysaccharide export LptBFGC system permease protein LptF